MIFKHLPAHWQRFRSKIFAAPLELRAFYLFAGLTTFLGILTTFIRPYHIMSAIVPYTDWGFASGYGYAFIFTSMLLFATRRKAKSISFIYSAILLMGMNVFFEINHFLHFRDNNFGNPYLTISPWQPIWTIFIPLFWMGILLSGNVRKFCKTKDAAAIQ